MQTKNILKIFRNNVLIGILVLAPVIATFMFLKWLFFTGTDFVIRLLPDIHKESLVWVIRFIAPLVIISSLILAGFIARFVFIRKIFGILEKVIKKIPLFGIIYTSLREITKSFSKSDGTQFKRLVLFEYPRNGLYTFGFITSREKHEIHEKTKSSDLNSIFIGTAPNPITGLVVFAPQKDLKELDMSVMDGLKLVLSGGIITPRNV